MNFVIGAGGVGSWLVPKLVRLTPDITIIDGDTLEKKNLDRQLFTEASIGMNKAEALMLHYDLQNPAIREYYHVGLLGDLKRDDILWCCADNHACRREVLYACDQYRCTAIFGANEYTEAEAYLYRPEWHGTPNDPRVFYPVILTDNSNDPLRPAGCVELSRGNEQLVLANALAADLMGWLYWFWTKEYPKLPVEARQFSPVMHKSNILKLQTIRLGDRLADQAAA